MDRRFLQEFSLFAENLWTPTEKLNLSIGLRYDKFFLHEVSGGHMPEPFEPDSIDGHFSPRVAGAYSINETTVIKASYQHGFRMPDAAFYDYNLASNAAAKKLGFQTSPPLTTETMDSYELNLHKEIDKNLMFDVNFFYNIFEDQLIWGRL